jgi:hypothetical protein
MIAPLIVFTAVAPEMAPVTASDESVPTEVMFGCDAVERVIAWFEDHVGAPATVSPVRVRVVPEARVRPPEAVRRPEPMVIAPLWMVFRDRVPFTSQIEGAPAVKVSAPPEVMLAAVVDELPMATPVAAEVPIEMVLAPSMLIAPLPDIAVSLKVNAARTLGADTARSTIRPMIRLEPRATLFIWGKVNSKILQLYCTTNRH